jgi:hypothetical protein
MLRDGCPCRGDLFIRVRRGVTDADAPSACSYMAKRTPPGTGTKPGFPTRTGTTRVVPANERLLS